MDLTFISSFVETPHWLIMQQNVPEAICMLLLRFFQICLRLKLHFLATLVRFVDVSGVDAVISEIKQSLQVINTSKLTRTEA